MGLAAGQARLLTITGRKSDCEFASMRISHQKIALSRELAALSNEYQNSLNLTTLIWDFYGTGDTTTPLSYGLLMNPSVLNDYSPVVLSDASGRVVLNSKYADAAKKAGIPQEGLGTLASENVRNKFINGLADSGLITQTLADTITSLPYSQGAGFGDTTTVSYTYQSGNYADLVDYIKKYGEDVSIPLHGCTFTKKDAYSAVWVDGSEINRGGQDSHVNDSQLKANIGDLLDGTKKIEYYTFSKETGRINGPDTVQVKAIQDSITDILGNVEAYLSSILDLGDGTTKEALNYAMECTQKLYLLKDDKTETHSVGKGSSITNWISGWQKDDKIVTGNARAYIGWTSMGDNSSNGVLGICSKNSRDCASISLNNILQAYITYFADYVNGSDRVTSKGNQIFDVKKGGKGGSTLAKDNHFFQYNWVPQVGGTEVGSDDVGEAVFYDTLFNQICSNGWVENDKVEDKEYLQQMLQNGMMFISRKKDDGFYYQGNYATDTYIKEIADESKIAYAESKYNTEKAKLNAKEETLDLKMKNLDTEISSLSTEYDTVKNTISKNIEKSFKRYSA